MANSKRNDASGRTAPTDTGRRGASAQQELANAVNSDEPVFPYPPDLPDDQKSIWCDIVNTKSGDYWTRGDLPLLRMYCRNVTDIERLAIEIQEEGEVIHNANGNPIINPKIVIKGYAEAKLMTLCTKLRMQPSSRYDVEVEASKTKKKAKANAAAHVINDDDEGLLAGTSLQ